MSKVREESKESNEDGSGTDEGRKQNEEREEENNEDGNNNGDEKREGNEREKETRDTSFPKK